MDPNETLQTMKLNDLLMINSKSIEVNNLEVSPKDMNTFIKLWLKGSNPRLEYIQIEYSTEEIPHVNKVMKGIKYTEVYEYKRRYFKCCRDKYTVRGGIDIQRKDGARATINIRQIDNRHTFEMFIWHDHCFGEDRTQGEFIEAVHELGEWLDRVAVLFNGVYDLDLAL